VLSQRPVDLEKDRDFVLELACMASFESVPAWYRDGSFRVYREGWFKSAFPKQVIADLKASLKDPQSLVEIWMEDDRPAGLLWLDFAESPQGKQIATLRDMVVEPGHQRRGIGRLMLQRVEECARIKGAGVVRVETSVENQATQAILQGAGFTVSRMTYEKAL
jgi:GNAT superfamily N-acetyltransferase